MLDQIARHGQMDLEILVKEILKWMISKIQQLPWRSFAKALGNKLGIERYGVCQWMTA
jgi:imidazoleglycerol-phosphate dehydratase/histidinol-phosphatase